jgi:hypothetical protein
MKMGIGEFSAKNMVASPYMITRDAGSEAELYDVRKFQNRLANVVDAGVDLWGNILCRYRYGTIVLDCFSRPSLWRQQLLAGH